MNLTELLILNKIQYSWEMFQELQTKKIFLKDLNFSLNLKYENFGFKLL